jgi:hypothetical protein
MAFFDRYNTDRGLEEEGVWVDFGDGVKVQVRRLTSKKSREYRRKLDKPYTAQFRGREMPDDLQEKLLNQQVAGVIIANWEGVPDPDAPPPAKEGDKPKMLEFSQEAALMMVQKFPDFRDDILTAAMERTTFEKEQREDARKN